MKNINPTTTNAWKALQQHHKTQSAVTIQQLFAQEKDRFTDYSLSFNNEVLVDFSKNNVTKETLGIIAPVSARMCIV